ncbi:MAG: helix-turn-helix domain-containing protein [Deltaproteobacteria bacterium]|nr:helix-turn-helix domain-containing protein [Deltaproteobacteria bacterium]
MAGAATVEKALDVLFHLHDAPGAQGVSEIARALGLAKSSCHRLLAALVDREVVEQDESGRYRPGLALLALGLGAQRREPVVELARPRLEAEAAALGETVFLVASRRGQLRVLDKVEGSGFLRAAPGVGDVIPADVTAAGKLYRAYHPVDLAERESAELEAIRSQGHAVNRDAWIEGLSVLAVPIWQPDAEGGLRIAAVLALAAASPRFEALGEAVIAERLRAAAAEVSGRLGARGAMPETQRLTRRETRRETTRERMR